MFCPDCGAWLPDGSRFCSKCGNRIDDSKIENKYQPQPTNSRKGTSVPARKRTAAGPGIKVLILAIVLLSIILAGMLIILFRMSPSARCSRQLNLGQRYMEESDYQAAIMAFSKAIEIDPKRAEPYQALADAYVEQGDYRSAFEILQSGMEDVDNKQKLQDKIEEVKNTPLKKEVLSWVEEPKYAYDDVEPAYAYRFGDYVGDKSVSDGVRSLFHTDDILFGAEMNFPSYSCLEEYYNVFSDETCRLFYMPEKVDSDKLNASSPFLIYDSRGIDLYLNDRDMQTDRYDAPWDVFYLDGDYVSDYGLGAFFWDDSSQQAYMQLESQYENVSILVPAADIPLHKAYAICKGEVFGNMILGKCEWADGESPLYEIHMDEASKYALWSPEGRLLTDFIYDDMESSSYGITAACKDGKWGYLDEQGEEITEFIYDAPWKINDDSSCAYPCTSDTMVISLDGEMGVLYRDGSMLIGYDVFEDIAPAWDDELWVKQDGLWGLIDLADAKEKKGCASENEGNADDTVKEIASYEIVRDERDKHGYEVEVYFERPVFEETTLGYQLINEFFEEQSDEFFSDSFLDYEYYDDGMLDTLWTLAEAYEPWGGGEPLLHYASAEVTYQSERLVSVSLFYMEMYGGSDYYWNESYLFHADSGKRIKLTEIIDGTEEEIKSMVEQAIYNEYSDHTELADIDLHNIIADYSLDELNFYVKEGKVHITFAKHAIFSGPGKVVDVTLPAIIKFQ